jgi:hypothetical protein
MIFLYSSELHLSHAGLVYILADFCANLLIWVVISTLMRVWSEVDQLNEVIQKYEETYDILLCGDMNASLHRDDRRRDRIFKKFTVESKL